MTNEQVESIRKAVALVTAANPPAEDRHAATDVVELVRAYAGRDNEAAMFDLIYGLMNLAMVLCVGAESALKLTPYQQLQQAVLWAERNVN